MEQLFLALAAVAALAYMYSKDTSPVANEMKLNDETKQKFADVDITRHRDYAVQSTGNRSLV